MLLLLIVRCRSSKRVSSRREGGFHCQNEDTKAERSQLYINKISASAISIELGYTTITTRSKDPSAMYTKAIVLACLAVCVFGRTAPSYQNDIPQESARSDESSVFSYLGDLKYAYKVYQECSAADLSSCLKVKLIGAMDRVARSSDDITLVDGVTFVKEENAAPEEPEKTEAEIDASLPRSLGEKNDALNGIIADKVFKFFDSHSLQVTI